MVATNLKISEQYLKYHDEYKAKFGEKTLILMQVGSFYEAYAVEINNVYHGPNLELLEELTDICIAHKGTDKTKYDYANPYMWGFPMIAENKYVGILIENGFTIVIINQIKENNEIIRQVSAVYSPATYLENSFKSTSNFIANIYIDEIQQKNNIPISCFGMSSVDVSTGEVYIHESYSKLDDVKFGLDDAFRFLSGISPKEIIIYKENICSLTDDKIIDYLALKDKLYQFRDYNKNYNKINYQKKILTLIYPKKENMINIIDSLNLSSSIYACKSLVHLLTYISDHYDSLINDLNEPKFYFSNTKLFLGNDAINQLNIIGKTNSLNISNTKYNNLMDVINKASTAMGKRYINMKFISPLTDPSELNNIYSIVEEIIDNKNDNKLYKNLLKKLTPIYDIERLYRKLAIGLLHPTQIVDFINSFKYIYNIFIYLKKYENISKQLNIDFTFRQQIKKLNLFLNKMINIDKAKLFNLNDIHENIFNIDVYPDLDNLQSQIGDNHDLIYQLLDKLDILIDIPSKDNKKKIVLKQSKQKGYYYQLTNKRFELLKNKLEENKYIDIDNKKIKYEDFIITKRNNLVDITLPFLKIQTTDINETLEKITKLTYDYYMNFLKEINSKYGNIIKDTINIITKLDYYTTIAKVSKEYNYVKPIIKSVENNNSYLDVINLRHPIVERIIEHEYIPHSINIGNELKGMLIYGLNSAGKSVLMKAIGISIIMAQAGFYVPADKFIYFPYKSLYTRITGNDNLFRGMSSYVLEITELNAILKRSDENTLVIGDEVCRGTEHISGNSIVAASLLKLSKSNSSFVFATHLHELMDLDIIKSNNNIKAFHLSVICDEINDKLIYDRILKLGSGEKIYGITVAKHIIKDLDFIKTAYEIKNQLLQQNIDAPVIDTKKSKYNTQLLVDKCEICGNKINLETHHINQQKDCEDDFVKNKKYIKKNHISNLTVLCQKCHDDLHNGKIKISQKIMTSNGSQII